MERFGDEFARCVYELGIIRNDLERVGDVLERVGYDMTRAGYELNIVGYELERFVDVGNSWKLVGNICRCVETSYVCVCKSCGCV